MRNCEMSGCMLPSANEWTQDILPISQRRSHLSESKVKKRLSQLIARNQANQAANGARVYFPYHPSLLPLNLLRDNTPASVIQPLRTDALQVEEAADWIQHPGARPSIPISPALSPQTGQASTSKQSLNNHDNGNNKNKNDRTDPLAQFYGKARAQQKLK